MKRRLKRRCKRAMKAKKELGANTRGRTSIWLTNNKYSL